jgi:iron-sulfur cluster repair protein YtfE (RIC family)
MTRLIESRSNLEHIRLLFRLFWENELKRHTESEEVFMKNLQMVPAVQQVESDHLRLEIMFAECGDYGYEELSEVVNLLENHIRFEEKVLFPRVPHLLVPVAAV